MSLKQRKVCVYLEHGTIPKRGEIKGHRGSSQPINDKQLFYYLC